MDLRAVELSDPSGDPEPEAGPVLGSRVTCLEHLLALVDGNTRAVVGHVEPCSVVEEPDRNGYTWAAVFDRIPEEVLEQA